MAQIELLPATIGAIAAAFLFLAAADTLAHHRDNTITRLTRLSSI